LNGAIRKEGDGHDPKTRNDYNKEQDAAEDERYAATDNADRALDIVTKMQMMTAIAGSTLLLGAKQKEVNRRDQISRAKYRRLLRVSQQRLML
jgi:hypothetical protein